MQISRIISALAFSVTTLASAQSFNPSKAPMHIVVGYPAGGATDLLARITADSLSGKFQVPIIVDNKPGANANIAAELVAKSSPNGLTLCLCAINNAINQSLYRKLAFSFSSDLIPVAVFARIPNILLVRNDLNVSNVGELIELGRKKPGGLTYASTGSGSSTHLSGALFGRASGLRLTHIPYKGSPSAIGGLLSGDVDMLFDSATTALPAARSGKVKALATSGASRYRYAPELSTVAEAGLPGFEVSPWFGLFAPKGTDQQIMASIGEALKESLSDPEYVKRLGALGAEPVELSQDSSKQFMRSEVMKWADVIKDAQISVD